MGLIAGCILLIFLIASLIFYRNWKYEQELDSLLWKVDFKDLQLNEEDMANTLGAKITRYFGRRETTIGRDWSPSRELVVQCTVGFQGESPADQNESGLSQLEHGRRLSIFRHIHHHLPVQGEDIRVGEGEEEVDRLDEVDEEGIEIGKNAVLRVRRASWAARNVKLEKFKAKDFTINSV